MTTDCTFYDPATGAITQVAELSDETLQHYAGTDTHFLVLVAGNMETQYVVDGALVDFTPDELTAKRAMPKGWIWQMPERVAVDGRTLDQARADKVTELSTACAAHILGGFVSSALGAAYTYPSTILDQHNLNGLVTRSLYPGNPAGWVEKFWCADADGVWARRDHTAAQLQQVGDEAIARITAAQARCDSKIAAANAATADQLTTLTWDSV